MGTDQFGDGVPQGLCGWCGSPFTQARVGRRREYCRASCKQRAFEARRERERIEAAVEAALTGGAVVSSRADIPGQVVPSRDDSSAPVAAPRSPGPVPAEVEAEPEDGALFALPVVDDPEAELARRLARWGIVDPPG